MSKVQISDSMVPAQFVTAVHTWKFGPAQDANGVKTFVVSSGGMPLTLNLQGCISPFDASSLSGGARKTLTLRLPQPWDNPFGEMEVNLVKEVAAKSPGLFGETLSEEQLLERYKPIAKKAGDYPRQLRTKLNTDGYHACRYWDAERVRAEPPADHKGCMFNAVVRLRALWISGDAWGIVCDCTDLQLLADDPVDCPF